MHSTPSSSARWRRVVERAAARVLDGPELERVLIAALDSPAMERLVARAIDSRLVDEAVAQLLESEGSGWLSRRSRRAPP